MNLIVRNLFLDNLYPLLFILIPLINYTNVSYSISSKKTCLTSLTSITSLTLMMYHPLRFSVEESLNIV